MKTTNLALSLLPLLLVAFSAAAQESPRDDVVVERDIPYGAAGDLPLKLDVIRPQQPGKESLPAIVWIHGGGWRQGNKSSGAGRLAPLVAGGDYVGFSVGYRLTDAASWPAQIHDCKAAIRWIRAHAKEYGVDPERIGVWGSSAGGHLVSMLGTSGGVTALEGKNGTADASSRVACVVDFCGPSDFLAFGKKNPGALGADSPVGLLLGGALDERQDAAKEASPITHVSKDDPPFLIVHGTEDRTVPLDQAERFHATLEKAGVDVTFVKINGGGHGIGGREVNERVKAFFDKHLRGSGGEVSAEVIEQER